MHMMHIPAEMHSSRSCAAEARSPKNEGQNALLLRIIQVPSEARQKRQDFVARFKSPGVRAERFQLL